MIVAIKRTRPSPRTIGLRRRRRRCDSGERVHGHRPTGATRARPVRTRGCGRAAALRPGHCHRSRVRLPAFGSPRPRRSQPPAFTPLHSDGQMAVSAPSAGGREMRGSLLKEAFAAEARRYLPGLATADLMPAPAGVRAQAVDPDGSLVDDFRIRRIGPVTAVRNALPRRDVLSCNRRVPGRRRPRRIARIQRLAQGTCCRPRVSAVVRRQAP